MLVIIKLLNQILRALTGKKVPDTDPKILAALSAIQASLATLPLIEQHLARIVILLSPAKAVAFAITLTPGDQMPKKNAVGIDFTIFENGMATATLTPVDAKGDPTSEPLDAAGNPVVPVWTASDPDIGISPSSDGLSALLTAGTTAITGATVTATATLTDGSTISGTSDPIDVVPQPPGAAVAFKIALSAAAAQPAQPAA